MKKIEDKDLNSTENIFTFLKGYIKESENTIDSYDELLASLVQAQWNANILENKKNRLDEKLNKFLQQIKKEI